MSVSADGAHVCPKCGRTIPPTQAQCVCMARPRYWLHSRETILLLSFVGLGVAFAVTGVAARTYHSQRRALAEQWHSRGVTELAAGRAETALADFRAAMIYARENLADEQLQQFQLDLTEALVATGRLDEARSYLLDLWQQTPGNSQVNLDLARLAVRDMDDQAARRYYDGAINGVWEGNPDQVTKDRFDTRLELYRYLTDRSETSAAQSVLLAAAASLPPDSPDFAQIGQLMLDAGHAQQALMEFEQVLHVDRRNNAALIGAGLASFDLADDVATVRYLEQASREKSKDAPSPEEAEQVNHTLAIAQMTLAIDPSRPGLSARERAQRTVRSYDTAVARLEGCAATRGIVLPKVSPQSRPGTVQATGLAGLYVQLMQMKPSVREPDLMRNPDQVESTLSLVFAAETASNGECGSPQDPADLALARIATRAQGAHQ